MQCQSVCYAISALTIGRNSTKFDVWVTWMGHALSYFFGPAPWGSKGQISCNFNYKVIFRDLFTKLCVCSHKYKIQNISEGIFILSPGSCTRGGTLGCRGFPGGRKLFFSKHGHVAYQIDGDDKQNRMQVFFHPMVTLVTLGWGQKVKYHWISASMSIIKLFYQTLCACLQIEDRKRIGQNFHTVAGVMPQGWDLGLLVGQKL